MSGQTDNGHTRDNGRKALINSTFFSIPNHPKNSFFLSLLFCYFSSSLPFSYLTFNFIILHHTLNTMVENCPFLIQNYMAYEWQKIVCVCAWVCVPFDFMLHYDRRIVSPI